MSEIKNIPEHTPEHGFSKEESAETASGASPETGFAPAPEKSDEPLLSPETPVLEELPSLRGESPKPKEILGISKLMEGSAAVLVDYGDSKSDISRVEMELIAVFEKKKTK
ncbi:hypothetical protein D4R52_01390 [bacterium]|nr:MAG: hypothetical protein D4R52_01390 [bacterium]